MPDVGTISCSCSVQNFCRVTLSYFSIYPDHDNFIRQTEWAIKPHQQ